jgi:hypothetical protein
MINFSSNMSRVEFPRYVENDFKLGHLEEGDDGVIRLYGIRLGADGGFQEPSVLLEITAPGDSDKENSIIDYEDVLDLARKGELVVFSRVQRNEGPKGGSSVVVFSKFERTDKGERVVGAMSYQKKVETDSEEK